MKLNIKMKITKTHADIRIFVIEVYTIEYKKISKLELIIT